jgi:hypothetical protein
MVGKLTVGAARGDSEGFGGAIGRNPLQGKL